MPSTKRELINKQRELKQAKRDLKYAHGKKGIDVANKLIWSLESDIERLAKQLNK